MDAVALLLLEVRRPTVAENDLAEITAPCHTEGRGSVVLHVDLNMACEVLGQPVVSRVEVERIGEPPDPPLDRRALFAGEPAVLSGKVARDE